MSVEIGEDLKLLIKSIHPSILIDAAVTVAESKWIMADNKNNLSKDDWVKDQAIDMFRQLNEEVNGT